METTHERNIREFNELEEWAQKRDARIMQTYRNRGYVKTKEDEQYLHQSFSPYHVPRGLTKLQIRRRINKYARSLENPVKFTEKDLLACLGHRLEISVDGKLILGASFMSKVPENQRQLKKLLLNLFNYKKVRVRRKL